MLFPLPHRAKNLHRYWMDTVNNCSFDLLHGSNIFHAPITSAIRNHGETVDTLSKLIFAIFIPFDAVWILTFALFNNQFRIHKSKKKITDNNSHLMTSNQQCCQVYFWWKNLVIWVRNYPMKSSKRSSFKFFINKQIFNQIENSSLFVFHSTNRVN